MTKYGYLGGLGLGTGIAPLPATPHPTHPGYTSSPPPVPVPSDTETDGTKAGRGAQIGSSTHFKSIDLRVPGYYRGL